MNSNERIRKGSAPDTRTLGILLMIFSVCCIMLAPGVVAFPFENNSYTDNRTVSANTTDYAAINGENFTSQTITNHNGSNQQSATQIFTSQPITTQNVTNQQTASLNFTRQPIATQNAANLKSATQNFTSQSISTQNFTYQNNTTQNITRQNVRAVVRAPAPALNRGSQYITPLGPAGTAFDASAYPQNTPQSNPMTISCYWDGNGHIYLSGDESAVTGLYADDDISVSVQPSGAGFTTSEHYACQHSVIDLTSMMTAGENSITITVLNTQGLSMSYGSSSGSGIDQIPTIVQVTDGPPHCSSGKTVDTSYPVIFFNALVELVRINDPHGAVTHYFLVIGNHTVYNACPSGPGAYTVTSDLIFYDCYTCVNTTPTPTPTGPTPTTTTPTVTPTPDLTFTPVPNDSRAPIADFTATPPLSGTAPLAVHFTDTSTRAPSRWTWLFGDGETSTLRNPTHRYSSQGTYTVSLTAANAYGADTERKTNYVTVMPRYTFSMTNTISKDDEYYHFSISEAEIHNMASWLNRSSSWTLYSTTSDLSVTKEDFGTTGRGLNYATLHWHSGHGTYTPRDLQNSGLALINPSKLDDCLKNHPNNDCRQCQDNKCIPCDLNKKRTTCDIKDYIDILTPEELAGKWAGENKWVVLSSCQVLADPRWNNVLGTTHGIFGFSTDSKSDPLLSDRFFKYAMEDKLPLKGAWINATIDVFDGVNVDGGLTPDGLGTIRIPISATVRFANESQSLNDHLPGYGIVEPDGNPNDVVMVDTWKCKRR